MFFRKKSLALLFSEAEGLRTRGEHGEAKLLFDRIAERAKGEDAGMHAAARTASEACRDALARGRIDEAKRLIRMRANTLAREELAHVKDTAADRALIDEAAAMLALLERPPAEDAVLDPAPSAGASDEETLALIMASWSAPRAHELEGLGEPLFAALLRAARGQPDAALKELRALATRTPDAPYLRLAMAELLLASEQKSAAEEALRAFLARAPEEDAETRLSAQRALADLRHQAGDAAGAEQVLMDACESMLDDPRPYLDLGHYLRTLGRAAEAVEVLKLSAAAFPAGKVEWPVLMELGLAHAQTGDRAAAREALQGAARTLRALGAPELPPALEAALAGLQASS